MFSKDAHKMVEALIQAELEESKQQHEEAFPSLAFASEVLSEELNEALEEVSNIMLFCHIVRVGSAGMDRQAESTILSNLEDAHSVVVKACMELAQVGAMILKLGEYLEGDKLNETNDNKACSCGSHTCCNACCKHTVRNGELHS